MYGLGPEYTNSSNAWSGTSAPDLSERQSKKPKFRKPTNREQAAFLLKAVTRDVRKSVKIAIGQRKHEIETLTSGLMYAERHELAALNPYAGERFRKCLVRALKDNPTGMDAHTVTIISESLNRDMNKGWASLDDARALIAACLGHFHHLMILQVGFRRISELEVNANGYRRYVYRNLMCLHAHGLVWGPEPLIQARLDKLPSALGAPGGYMELYDPERSWLRYALEDPRLIECRGKTNGKVRGWIKQVAAISQKLQVRLVRYLHGETKPSLCVAVGFGQEVLEAAINNAQKKGYSGP